VGEFFSQEFGRVRILKNVRLWNNEEICDSFEEKKVRENYEIE